MSEMSFGNIWHGRLSASGLTPEGGAEIASVTVTTGNGGATVLSYFSPYLFENIGYTYYYRKPGVPEASTPGLVSTLGGSFKNDAILFGEFQRYSPFGDGGGSVGLLGKRCWLHWGSNGKWRKMSLGIVSTGDGSAPVISITRHEQFGLINKAAPYEATLLAEITLGGKFVNDPVMSDIDVRHDGRQIVIHLRGKWTNSTDPAGVGVASVPDVPFDNSGYCAIAAAWRIDIADDCTSASATRVWLASDPGNTATQDRSWWEPTGDLYYENGKYFQPIAGIAQVGIDSLFVFERLVGVGFTPSGDLLLVKYSYRSELIGEWAEHTGIAARGYTPVPFLPQGGLSPGWAPGSPKTSIWHPSSVTFQIALSSGGALKTFSSPLDPPPFAVMKTNNASDFRQPSLSICRLAPGCIEDFPISGNGDFLHVAFNPRAGSVHSSGSAIGFV